LTVTVWSPDVSGSLPVMAWIPGGAFLNGAGQLQVYNGSRLAANGNVVVVNITYRVGVFGGFELGELGEGFDDNLCLRDQIAALAWVRDNIAAFGGDAERVTVFGESCAGGHCCRRHVRRPDMGIRRCLQRARADLCISIRPHAVDFAGDGTGRSARQRNCARVA
jgi:carboxylesterase type B